MRYFIVFGIYDNDGDVFSAQFVYVNKDFPSKKMLDEYMEFKTFAKFKGVSGIKEISKDEIDNWLK